MGCKKRKKQTNSIPNLSPNGVVDTDKLSRGCIGMEQEQVNAIPWMSLRCRTKFFGYILKFTLAHKPFRIRSTTLIDSFDNVDSHRFCKCDKFRTILVVSNKQQCFSTLVIGLGFIGYQSTCASKEVSIRFRHVDSLRGQLLISCIILIGGNSNEHPCRPNTML